MSKMRIMYVLYQYPQISETYIRTEIEAVRDECDLRVISLRPADTPYKTYEPYILTDDADAIRREIQQFRPHALHTHWLLHVRELAYLGGYFRQAAAEAAIPFTVRAHSFDVLDHRHKYVKEAAPFINSDLCLGVLTFPFTRPIFQQCGVRDDKVLDCWPVINYDRFHEESPNGPDVMNVGACLPKKQMQDFLKLAKLVPHRRFDLYALGYRSREIDKLNAEMGHPVNIIPPVEPESMLKEYKRHQWLVYTASPELGTVGWPLALAEAQAAGVGVCFPRLRPDLQEYVGPAGYLYDSIEQVAQIISEPLPEDRRRLGFQHAKRSDAFEHRKLLLDLWRKTAAGAAPPAHVRGADGLPDWGDGQTTLEHSWRARSLAAQLDAVIPQGATLIEAGDASESTGLRAERRILPFIERDGQFWGLPENDDVAISELERMREAGATAILFRSSNFWWFDHYRRFTDYLHSRYRPSIQNKRFALFDIAHPMHDSTPETYTRSSNNAF